MFPVAQPSPMSMLYDPNIVPNRFDVVGKSTILSPEDFGHLALRLFFLAFAR